MIINPNKKKEYSMVKAKAVSYGAIITYTEMKDSILNSFPSDIPKPDKLEFGYVEPGHGLRGKKEWILDDDDMNEFLEKYRSKKKKELTLWCYSQGKGSQRKDNKENKRSQPSKPGSSRYEAHNAKMARVDEIYKKIHNEQYSAEQKRSWAHLIEMGKHDSLTEPPKKRFFKSPSAVQSPVKNTATASVVAPCSTLASPGRRRVSIRSECIDQLQKWHSLLDCGAISKEQYDELQSTILSDIKKL